MPLIVHSAYSLGRGTATPERLLRRAEAIGLDALALTDRDNLYGALAFLKKSVEIGIHPVLGAEVTPREGPPSLPGDGGTRGMTRGPCSARGSVVLLIREASGYRSLCRILTARHLSPVFDLIEQIAGNAEGLIALATDPVTFDRLDRAMPPDQLHAAVVRPSFDHAEERRLRDAALKCGRPVVGTVDVYFDTKERFMAHTVLSAIREIELVSRLAEDRLAHETCYMPDPTEIFDLFADDPGAIAAARELAWNCRFTPADLPSPGSLLPKLPLPERETAYDRLYRMTQEGLGRRYRRITPQIVHRLSWELEQINSMGFADYFVVVGDICAAARARGIPTVGRGSGASSLISYLLGITNVDPIRYRLTFERFLHRLRHDLPDLDIDLCWRRRDEVIDYVYETYGSERVAMISTHNKYHSRGAFREAAKAVGFSAGQVDDISRAIPSFSEELLADAIRSTPLGRNLDLSAPPMPEALDAADNLIGLPHTLGIHCGGIVIGPGPLDNWVPLETATKGIVVTQYEMHAIEAIGLVKIDLLGNRAISTIAGTLSAIEESGGAIPDLDAICHTDSETAQLLEVGDTLGCFQIESPGMRNLLKMLRTCDLDGTIAALSLIRPGPAGSGMKERFVRRSRGIEQTTYLHRSLEELLSSTHGILLYEEDVICVASEIGGFDRAVGDLLRRAIASATAIAPDPSLGERLESLSVDWEKTDDPWRGKPMRELENRFVACAAGNGVPADVACKVWAELARFGSYAFCKAHASGYGVLAYQATYLKARHTGPFYAALLNNHQGMYPVRVHVEDARRHGVDLEAPCVHASVKGWSWDGSFLRCGLAQVRGLTRRTCDAIIEQREKGRFEDVDDFIERTGANTAEVSALILSGALDSVGAGPRPARLWRLQCLSRKGSGSRDRGSARLGLGSESNDTTGPWREFDAEERVGHELETLDVAITAHPVALLCKRLRREGKMPAVVPASRIGQEEAVTVIGMVAAGRRVKTKRGDPMLFLTLEDPTGLTECTLFPEVYDQFATHVRSNAVLLAKGTVEAPYGAPTVTVESLEPID